MKRFTINGTATSFISDDLELVSAGDTEEILSIPDANFKSVLVIDTRINTNADSEIQVSEASAFVGQITVNGQSIADMTGVEHFPLLTGLDCSNNQITALDVSSNTQLQTLHVSNNQLNTLNVQNGNNASFTAFAVNGNPDLTCIQVDNVAFAESNWTNVDDAASFSTECSQALGLEPFAHLSIYPNPATNEINLSNGFSADKIDIQSLSGSLLLSGRGNYLDVRSLVPGIYIVTIYKGSDRKSFKILKTDRK